jgi:hypothetical protein
VKPGLAALLLLAGALAVVLLALWAVFFVAPPCHEALPEDDPRYLVGPACPPSSAVT